MQISPGFEIIASKLADAYTRMDMRHSEDFLRSSNGLANFSFFGFGQFAHLSAK